jgi:RimJ/RimL family protein N-acetyltransferase
MTAASQPQLVTLRSGDVVRIRPVRPQDAPALVRAYANLGEQSRYRRFFTIMPELPEATLKAAVEVDHTDHEALVAVPLLSAEIVGECRFIRLPDQPDTAEVGVTVVDAWQGRGLGSALLARLSERAAEAGIEYFTAEILAENRTMLGLLPSLGEVETESRGPVVTTRVELGEPPRPATPDFLDLLTAAARGEIMSLPVLLRRLIRVPEGLAHIVRMPVSTVLQAWRPRSPDSLETVSFPRWPGPRAHGSAADRGRAPRPRRRPRCRWRRPPVPGRLRPRRSRLRRARPRSAPSPREPR